MHIKAIYWRESLNKEAPTNCVCKIALADFRLLPSPQTMSLYDRTREKIQIANVSPRN